MEIRLTQVLSLLLIFSVFQGCSSAKKQRLEEREKLAAQNGFSCQFINGDQYADFEVVLNIEMAKRCDASKPFSVSEFKSAADIHGLVYCCSTKPKTPAAHEGHEGREAHKAPSAKSSEKPEHEQPMAPLKPAAESSKGEKPSAPSAMAPASPSAPASTEKAASTPGDSMADKSPAKPVDKANAKPVENAPDNGPKMESQPKAPGPESTDLDQ